MEPTSEDVESIVNGANEGGTLGSGGETDVDTTSHGEAFFKEALAFYTGYDTSHDLADLDASISLYRQALDYLPDDHPSRPWALWRHGCGLLQRFRVSGDRSDLRNAVEYHRKTLDRPLEASSDNPDRSTVLSDMAGCMLAEFRQSSHLDDLSLSIQFARESLCFQGVGHRGRADSLTQLALCLEDRFLQTFDMTDLEEAISCHEEVLSIYGDNHKDLWITLNNAAICFMDRYKYRDDPKDLDRAIDHMRTALPLSTASPHTLNNLAISLLYRFHRRTDPDDLCDLDEATDCHRQALALRRPGNPDRMMSLANLALCLYYRYKCSRNRHDVEECIPLQEEAVSLSTSGHPWRAGDLKMLATMLMERLSGLGDEGSGTLDDVREQARIMSLLREASTDEPSSISERLEAAQEWRRVAGEYHDTSEMEAYRTTLRLLDVAMSRSQTLEKQYSQLSTGRTIHGASGIAVDAAALAISLGDPKLALTLLEQGRAVIFRRLGEFRTALDEVRLVAPQLAQKFEDLSHELDSFVVSAGRKEAETLPRTQFEDDHSRHLKVSAAWSTVGAEIRAIEGFQSFLQPAQYDQLRLAAQHGPVIVVNISGRRSDAVIISFSAPPIVIPLPYAAPPDLATLAERLGQRPAEINEQDAIEVLREIWRVIVQPVVHELRGSSINLPLGSRIWWCPTGAASRLPLHAAGSYLPGRRDLYHMYISSYTPTLGTLIRARRPLFSATPTHPNILVISQSETPGEKPLPNATVELQHILQHVPNASVLAEDHGTREAALSGIPQHAWLHLACHGHHNDTQPFLSHFSMYDAPLPLLDLIKSDLPAAELAVLSACHSARVSEELPDESLHPAAGMLFAGFRSVIATMWALDDGIGPEFSDRFYGQMCGGKGGVKDPTYSAVALKKAVNELGKKGLPLMQRINLVHFGI